MIAVIDTSIVLRSILREPQPLREWKDIDIAYASRLLPVEAGRVVDRLRLVGAIDDAEVETLHMRLREILSTLEIISLSEAILSRASAPMPTSLRTLDAIHLATALELKTELDEPLVLATHDAQLARAARASGLDVVGA